MDKLNKLLDKNKIILNNLNNLTQDMKDLLDIKSTLIYNNCNNMKIIINSKINYIYFLNCKNINLKIKSLISGFKIQNSSNINFELFNCKNKINIEINKSNDCIIKMKKINKDDKLIDINKSKKIIFKYKY